MADESRSERPLKEHQPTIMFGSPLAKAASIVGLAVGALGLALAVGASAAYLVIPSYDERSADEGAPVVSVATRTQDGVPAARDARDAGDAGAVTAPQAKLGERADGVGMSPSASATTTPSASATPSSSQMPSASAAAVRKAAVRKAAVRETPVYEAPVYEAPVYEAPVRETPVRETPVRETPVRENDPPSGPSARSADGVGRPASASASASATPSVPATAPAKPPSTTWQSWWWRSGSGR